MSDEPFYKPRRKPAPLRQVKPGEFLFEFYRERDHSRWLCELRDDGDYGVMAQFYQNEEFFCGRRFVQQMDLTRTPREMAIAFAEEAQSDRGLTSSLTPPSRAGRFARRSSNRSGRR